MTQQIDIDGHRLVANCAPMFDAAARSMLEKFAQLHRRGPALKPGSRIDFGWSLLQIEAHGNEWVVCEPDYRTDPLRWKPQVDDTVRVLRRQIEVNARAGNAASERTRGDQWVFVLDGALEAERVVLRRSKPASDEDSGWVAGIVDQDPSVAEGSALRAGDLLEAHYDWVAVLALPVGFSARFGRDGLLTIENAAGDLVYPS